MFTQAAHIQVQQFTQVALVQQFCYKLKPAGLININLSVTLI